jgi:8-oxo-dGTP diphosphatase
MDLVREFYRRLNLSDADALAALYHADCVVEYVFSGDLAVYEGRDVVRAKWAEEFGARRGVLPGSRRAEVHRVAGIETGWGWVRAEWVAGWRNVRDGSERHEKGYSHFWIEDGTIRRHRRVARPLPSADAVAPLPVEGGEGRRYPGRPVVGVGAVVFEEDGRVVLVRRRQEPLAGQWSLPGGTLELGESLEAGAAREVFEETGLVVDVGEVVDVFDRILLDEDARVQFHFVLVDYLCTRRAGVLAAGSDVSDVALVAPADAGAYRLTEKAFEVVRRAVVMRERPDLFPR